MRWRGGGRLSTGRIGRGRSRLGCRWIVVGLLGGSRLGGRDRTLWLWVVRVVFVVVSCFGGEVLDGCDGV